MSSAVYIKSWPNLDRLIARHGQTKAGEMIGLASGSLGSVLAKSRDAGGVRLAYELAAELILSKEEPKRKETTFFVRVPAEHHDLVQTMLTGLAPLGVKNLTFKE